tara:strand:- start:245 stop:427 length:183 start_codon:yes stop_codon:yes gene_type:complete
MNEKREFITYVRTEDFTNVLYADISILVVILLLTVLWKEQRALMIAGLALYSFSTFLWHY